MKIERMIQILSLLSIFVCTSVLADANLLDNSSVYQDHYGRFDAVYPDELRIVIDDMSFVYKSGTSFFDTNGLRVKDIKKTIKPGTPVKFHVINDSPYSIIRDLGIVSEKEYNQIKKNASMRDNN